MSTSLDTTDAHISLFGFYQMFGDICSNEPQIEPNLVIATNTTCDDGKSDISNDRTMFLYD